MTTELINTKYKIIDAAKQVFIQKGLENAKMQDIADVANISRTSLNYYFKTKENLFYELIEQILDSIIPQVGSLLESSQSIKKKIEGIIDVYDSMLRSNNLIPHFFVLELQRNPDIIYNFINKNKKIKKYLELLSRMFSEEMKNNSKLVHQSSQQLLTIFWGLLFGPYLLNPLLNKYRKKNKSMDAFLDDHKILIKQVLVNLIC